MESMLGPKFILLGVACFASVTAGAFWFVGNAQEEPSFDVPLISALGKKMIAWVLLLISGLLVATFFLYPKF